MEGYTDVMACHLAGVPTAVATSGTSFGDGHIRILRRLLMDASEFRGEVIFTFDGDAAGQRAALRAFGMEDKFVTQTFVTVQPDGLDPCDLRLARGDAAVRDLVARRVPLFEFAIRSELTPVRPRHDRGPPGRARRRRPDRGADQGQGPAEAVRGRAGPLARHHGRAVRARPGPRARGAGAGQGPAAGPAGRSGQRQPLPRQRCRRPAGTADPRAGTPGGTGQHSAAGRARAPARRRTAPTIRGIRSCRWSARHSSLPCSGRACAGPASRSWAPRRSRSPRTPGLPADLPAQRLGATRRPPRTGRPSRVRRRTRAAGRRPAAVAPAAAGSGRRTCGKPRPTSRPGRW